MINKKSVVLIAVVCLMGGTAVALTWLKKNQKLGRPGIRATPTAGSLVMNFDLPEKVLNFTSTNLPQSEVVLGYLPKDTSFAQRRYTATNDDFWVNANIVLMGADRSSIHKPDYCLSGQGFGTLSQTVVTIPIGGPQPYELPVSKWVGARFVEAPNGQKVEWHALYVFWFVADGEQTPSHNNINFWMMRDLFFTGVLQRWAYVSYFAVCTPGQEEACFERVKELIAASVPEFQVPPKSASASAAVAKQ